ncbi:hypothetical protein QZH41_000035 [Actinostola sp. cb2023]|nr:hypothetical protein QZH41_000035 [Actinostola sp. cb2023]
MDRLMEQYIRIKKNAFVFQSLRKTDQEGPKSSGLISGVSPKGKQPTFEWWEQEEFNAGLPILPIGQFSYMKQEARCPPRTTGLKAKKLLVKRGVPVMALTATLTDDEIQTLRDRYLDSPVLLRSSVDRPNIKLNVGKYVAKRPVKGDKSGVWVDASKQVSKLIGEESEIVYLDFKKDVDLMPISQLTGGVY